MLVCPDEILQNHPNTIEGVKVHDSSFQDWRKLLRVAASSNISLDTDPQLQAAASPQMLRSGQKFWLTPSVVLADHTGLSDRQLREAQTIVEAHIQEIQHAWNYHFDS